MESFPEEGQPLSLSRHTCVHCQKFVVDLKTSPTAYVKGAQKWTQFRNTFQCTAAELFQASREACPIFERLVAGCSHDVLSCIANDCHRSVDVRLDLTSVSPEKTGFDVKGAKVSCWWTDTKECLLNDEGIDQNIYAFEVEPNDPAGVYVRNRPSYPYVVSDFTFEIIRAWLERCEDHVECMAAIQTVHAGNEGQLPGPSRLLHINPDVSVVPKVKIIDTHDTEKYTALSYCWGKDSSMRLLRSTIEAWKEELPYDELPRTIQDAICTTRRLGIEHLWVDRICIVQDDYEDLKKELSAMARIYQRSFLTISAASAPSAIDGFLQYHTQASALMQKSRINIVYRCPDGVEGTVGMKSKVPYINGEYSPNMKAVDARAWTMQEQILSTRIVHFCTNMLVWNCLCTEGGHAYVEGAATIPSNLLFTDPAVQPFMDPRQSRFEHLGWTDVVELYTQRELSVPADKLVAVSALAERFAEIYQSSLGYHPRYLAGMWEHDLRISLCWYLNTRLCSPQRRAVEYRAPSWSWASVDGAVITLRRPYRPTACEILAFDTELASISMPYHSVISGYLTVRGRLREEIWDRKRQKLLGSVGRDYLSDDAPDGLADALDTDLEEDEHGTILVTCLLMGEDGGRNRTPYGLILSKVPDSPDLYRRVGYFEFELFESSSNVIDFSFQDCEEQIITII
ncbi:heterokaryon incompatibility protein-domain-containing protein [Rhexocercosporidium sp. MPI-PUGE-AT-0058]|nr:heterokaryon incompatibility protein-domain-containing protein [Rhexocercosporidium sp. MPI-PUGE-AT-0058]